MTRGSKVVILFILIASGLYGAFVFGERYSSSKQTQTEQLKSQIGGGISGDGRFGTRCAIADDGVCSVPFSRLVAFPERYHDKEISVSGVLTRTPGGDVYELAQSREHARVSVSYDKFLIACHIPEGLREKAKDGVWVTVDGKFNALIWKLDSLGRICARNVNEIDEAMPSASVAPTVRLVNPKAPGSSPPHF